MALLFGLGVLVACGRGNDEIAGQLAFAPTTTTTTTIVPVGDAAPSDVEATAPIDVSADDPAGRCGIEDPMLGEIELLPNDYLAVVASPESLPAAAFDRLPGSLSLNGRSAVCLDAIESGATRGCGVQTRGSEQFTLHLEAVTFVATVVMEDGSAPHRAAPMHVVEDCPGDPNDANPTLYPAAASSDVRVEPSVVGRDELIELVTSALLQWEAATTQQPFSANRCESLGLTVERLEVLHDDLATFFGSDGRLFPPSTPAATSAHAVEVQERIDWFGEASSTSLVRFEGDATRVLLAELHLNMILWNDVAEAVAERQDSVPEALRGAWLHWRLGNAMRSSSIVHAAATEAHLLDLAASRCAPENLVVSDADPAPVCALLQQVYERRHSFRSETGVQLWGMFDWLQDVNELHPPGLNPFFDPVALEALINVEYAIDSELRYGTPMDRTEVAANEDAAEPIHVFAETSCSDIDVSMIRLESALEAVPVATAAQVSEQRAVFCSTLHAFTEQRAIFRSGVGTGAPQGEFPPAQRDAWDELRRLALELKDQKQEHGAAIEPDSSRADDLRIGRLTHMVELENALRLWVFSEHPVPLKPMIEWQEEEAAVFLAWGEQNCSESFATVPSVFSYDIGIAPDTFLTGFPSSAEMAAVFCPNVEDALHARLAFQHQLATFDLTDDDRLTDIWLTSSRFTNATYSLVGPYEANGGDPELADAFGNSLSGVTWSVVEDEPFDEWERVAQDGATAFLDDLPRACPDLPDVLITGLGSMEDLATEARLKNRPAADAAIGERLEVRNDGTDGSETVWAITVGPIVDQTTVALQNGAVLEAPDGRFVGFDVSITLVASAEEQQRWVFGDLEPILHVGGDWSFPFGCELDDAFDGNAYLAVGETATGTVCGEVSESEVPGMRPAVFNGLDMIFFD